MRWLWGVLICAGLASWLLRPEARKRYEPAAAGKASVVIAPAGGEVLEVLVRPGDRVEAGQVLLRAKAVRSTEANAKLNEAVERLERLPDGVWKQAEQSDPRRIAADRTYVKSLAEWERLGSAEAKAAMERAREAREVEYRRVSPFSREALREWQKRAGIYEVQANAAGRVEILDWKVGDNLPTPARVALIAQ